jgi:hypothetical protein
VDRRLDELGSPDQPKRAQFLIHSDGLLACRQEVLAPWTALSIAAISRTLIVARKAQGLKILERNGRIRTNSFVLETVRELNLPVVVRVARNATKGVGNGTL